MVEAALSESWQIVHAHIVPMEIILQKLVEGGVRSGEFPAQDALVAARCIQSALLRFCHPALIEQCGEEPGPSLDEMADFILAALKAPLRAAAT